MGFAGAEGDGLAGGLALVADVLAGAEGLVAALGGSAFATCCRAGAGASALGDEGREVTDVGVVGLLDVGLGEAAVVDEVALVLRGEVEHDGGFSALHVDDDLVAVRASLDVVDVEHLEGEVPVADEGELQRAIVPTVAEAPLETTVLLVDRNLFLVGERLQLNAPLVGRVRHHEIVGGRLGERLEGTIDAIFAIVVAVVEMIVVAAVVILIVAAVVVAVV